MGKEEPARAALDRRVIRLLRFPWRGTRRSVVTISCGDFNEYNQHALTRCMRFYRSLSIVAPAAVSLAAR
jgi:hypothetical protein